jgi:transcriptional regulator with XRE-family HTH domain
MLEAVGNLQTHTASSCNATGEDRLTDIEQDRNFLRDWLRSNLTERGITPTKAAKEIGVATSTLTKFLNDPNYSFTPSTPVIARLERFFGRAAPRTAPNRGGALPEIEATPVNPESLPAPQREALAALTAGRRGIETWSVLGNYLQGAGVQPGDMLLVDLFENPRAGDIVCAEIHEQGAKRTVFRVYEKPYLVAATFETKSWMPIVVDDRNVIVRGVVTERMAKRRMI